MANFVDGITNSPLPHMESIELVNGTRCLYHGKIIRLHQVVDLQTVISHYESSGELVITPIKDLQPIGNVAEDKQDVFASIPAQAYAKAQHKLEILQPLLHGVPSGALVAEVALAKKVGCSTLRRWLRLYKQGGTVLSLVEKERTGGRGGSRLAPEAEAIVQQVITKHYLTSQSKAPAHVFEELQRKFENTTMSTPTEKTLRLRLKRIEPRLLEEKRVSARAAKERFAPTRTNTLVATRPLQIVQLDHALLNIVLVHEETRQQMSRPWLTIATDIFSRMVVGIHLSFEEPGAGGTGLCLAQAILPKETWLSERNIVGEWPCWGPMEALHLDNAKEFHGMMLQRASELYGIKLMYRPPKRPEYGGHIERLIRTIKFHVRRLAGGLITRQRGRRRLAMPRKPVFSLPEFERWLATYIVSIYHNREHKALGITPYERYQQGILGKAGQSGTGVPPRYHDELQVRLDFMPIIERSIQRYGVLIDRFHYYAEVLRSFIGNRESGSDGQTRRKFIFKRDPRDLRQIYFLHPDTLRYHKIPLANMARPMISLWEQREIVRQELARNPDRTRITEALVFKGLDNLEVIEKEAIRKTGRMTKAGRRLRNNAATINQSSEVTAQLNSTQNTFPSFPLAMDEKSFGETDQSFDIFTDITPFENLDDGTSNS